MTHPPTPKATRSTRATTRRLQKQTKEEFLREIAAQIPEDLSEAEAVGILLGRLETARRAFRSARLRQGMREVGVDFLPIPDAHNSTLPAPVPPKAILSYLNRSRIWPCLVPPEPTSKVPLTELLQVIRDRHRSGEPWYRLLDLLVTGAGMPWQSGAKILRNLTGQIIEDDDFTMVAQARSCLVDFFEGKSRRLIISKTQDKTITRAGARAHAARSMSLGHTAVSGHVAQSGTPGWHQPRPICQAGRSSAPGRAGCILEKEERAFSSWPKRRT